MASETPGVPLDRSHSGALNLAVLQRSDPSIEAIVASASHAAVYENRSNTEWTKKNIEGAVFVVKRSMEPRYELIVMNRLSRSNLVQSVTGTLELQTVKPPYLMFRDTAAPELGVLGIWFHDEADRRAIAATLHKLVVRAARRVAAGNDASADPAQIAAPPPPGRALLDLVKKGGGGGAAPAAATPKPAAPALPALAPSVGALFNHAAHAAPAPAHEPAAGAAAAAAPGARAAVGNAVADLFARATLASAPPAPAPQARSAVPPIAVLTKSQLVTALLELAGDDSFIDTLHAAYTASVARRQRTAHG